MLVGLMVAYKEEKQTRGKQIACSLFLGFIVELQKKNSRAVKPKTGKEDKGRMRIVGGIIWYERGCLLWGEKSMLELTSPAHAQRASSRLPITT